MSKWFSPLCLFLSLFVSLSASGRVSAADVDGRPDFKAGDKAAVYVWREASGVWKLRLASGGLSQNFNGGVSIARYPFDTVAPAMLEGADSFRRTYPGQVEVELKVGGNDYLDGVDFSFPADTGACLWGWGSLGKKVFLGAKQVPATLPVDLLGTGACGRNGGEPAKPALKYNPGHYIALNDWDGPTQMIEAIRPGVRGIHKRYTWRELEPSFGVYDFSGIERDLQIAQDHGVQLVIMIEDKSFSTSVKVTPEYLWANHTLPYTAGGWVAKRWAPWVIERMAALTQAMGKRFDSHPNFEGVAFQESAMGFTQAIQKQHNYTPEAYRDALIQQLINTRRHFPTSQVFWYMNFLEGRQAYLAEVIEAVIPHQIAMGGPDVLPDNGALTRLTYPLYDQFKGRLTMFNSVQYDSYKHLHATKGYATKYWTPYQLFVFARDRLHVNYLFWTRKPRPDPADSYYWGDALGVIRNNPSFNQ